MEAYEALLSEEGLVSEQPAPTPDVATTTLQITVSEIQIATVNGESFIYISSPDDTGNNRLFRSALSADESLLLIRRGDTVELAVIETETKGIFKIASWSFVKNS